MTDVTDEQISQLLEELLMEVDYDIYKDYFVHPEEWDETGESHFVLNVIVRKWLDKIND